MDDIQTLLNEEIVRRLKELPTLDSGTKEIGAAIEDIEHLCKIRLAELQQDCEAQARAREERDTRWPPSRASRKKTWRR